ncbi:MAG: SDR family oxidoreductase [Acidobacteriota bacterium]
MAPDSAPDPEAEARRVALITGGGKGIGLAVAKALRKQGCSIAISGRREDVLRAAARDIGAGTLAVVGDVASPADAKRMVQETIDKLGDLHVLVNNAAIWRTGPIESLDDDSIDQLIDIDVKGPFYLVRHALPQLRRHRSTATAAILNVGSSVTSRPLVHYALYSAAKAALDMMTRCLALELAEDRIRVNAVLPGIVETPIFGTMMPTEKIEGYLERFEELIPLGRAGRPEDVGRVAAWLCDPANDWLTGALVPIDGGLGLGSGR